MSAQPRTSTPRMRTTPAVRWRASQPAQRRGRETQERFARAAEALLLRRAFEDITVQDIVRRARRPIGSFYARFASKEALLPFLYARYHDGLEARFERTFTGRSVTTRTLAAAIRLVVDFFVDAYQERRELIRTLALFARRHPEALPAGMLEQRRRLYALPEATLARHRRRIAHPDPGQAIRLGIYMVSCVARERVLFGDMPHAQVTDVGLSALRLELVRMLQAYLTREVPT